MLDSLNVGMTGLQGFSQGLRVIANNTANMNTPGFKSASLNFADMYYTGQRGAGGDGEFVGHGLATVGTRLSFKNGEQRQTGNELDLAIDGQGLFVLRGDDGALSYTRAGQFMFRDGTLVHTSSGAQVMAVGEAGTPAPISLAASQTVAGAATTSVKFAGNLSSTATEQTVPEVRVLDASGEEHVLSLKLVNTNSSKPGSWKVELLDGTTSVGSGEIVFANGSPQGGASIVTVSYTPPGKSAMSLALDFGSNVTSFAAGSLSSLAVASQDGSAPGNLTGSRFDTKGRLQLTYSNGRTVAGPRLLLARFLNDDAVRPAGDNVFAAVDPSQWRTGLANDRGFGTISSGSIELSNVDLSREFSNLVVIQRGYQASSQIVSTANEMLQQLFTTVGK